MLCGQEEAEKEEQYFSALEKKEAMEEAMASVTQIKCKAVYCKQVHAAVKSSSFVLV